MTAPLRHAAAFCVFLCACTCGRPEVSAEKSSISATPKTLDADGVASSEVTVVLRDATGAGIRGAPVEVSVDGDATLEPSSGTTDSLGLATFSLKSTVPGTKTVSASSGRIGLAKGATVTFVAPPATQLAFRVPPSSAAIGANLSPAVVVEARDTLGRVATGFRGDVTVGLTAANGAVLAGQKTISAADGVATFSSLSVNKLGSYTLTATAQGLIAATSATFDVTVLPPASLVFVTGPQSQTAGTALANIVVEVRDSAGVRVAGATTQVTLAIATGPAGAMLGGTATVAASDGRATFTGVTLTRAGSYTLAATATGLAGAMSSSFNIAAGAAVELVYLQQPQGGQVRAPFGVTLAVRDLHGNVATTSTAAVTLMLSSGVVSGTATRNATTGIATFSGLSVDQEGSYTLAATSAGLTSATSGAFTIADTTSPATPALSVTGKTRTQVSLAWAAPGDDGNAGRATSHELRWATAPLTPANFGTGTVVPLGAVPDAGVMLSATVGSLASDTSHHFGLRYADSAGNASFATAMAVTDGCPVGYAGPQCDQCAVGYREVDAGVCTDYCTPDPCNPAPPDSCAGNLATAYPRPRTCSISAATPFFTCAAPTVTDCADAGNVCITGGCVVPSAPVPGDLVVSEVMQASAAGQYLEVANVSGRLLTLGGLTVETVGSGGGTFSLTAAPQPLLPFALALITPDAGVDLSAPRRLRLSLGTLVIDDVDWGALAPVVPPGTAVEVSSAALGPGADQRSWYWCAATSPLGSGFGTPGATNGTCGVTLAPPVDWCVLQSPKTLGTVEAPAVTTVYGRFYEPSATDRNPNGNDFYPLVVGELGFGAVDGGALDPLSWTWSRGAFNPGYVDSDAFTDRDELLASFAPAVSGDYRYGWRFRMVDPATGAASAHLYCDQNGPVTDLPNGTWGTATVWAPSIAIAAARAAAADGGALSIRIDGAKVTYVKPAVDAEPAGFFVQGEPSGPALFVGVASVVPTPAVGDRVAFTVNAMGTLSGLRYATAVNAYARIETSVAVAPLVQDLSGAADVVSALGSYDSELVTAAGSVAGAFADAGSGFVAAPFDTGASLFRVRLPAQVQAQVDLTQGCLVRATAPLWRELALPQLTAWVQADVQVTSCPAPRVLSAAASMGSSVTVVFDRVIAGASVLADGSQFTIVPPLAVSAAAATGPRQVTLGTAVQLPGAGYTVTVAPTVLDLYGRGVVAPFDSAMFSGPMLCMPSQVVVSQLFGGGGNTGAPWQGDFIELHNRSLSAVAIGGWSVQYASSTGSTWAVTPIPAGTVLQPGAYFLIQESATGGMGQPLPTPDVTGTISMAAAAAKVAVVSSTTALTGTCPTGGALVDLVGYGSGANCAEGMAPTPDLSNTTAAIRKAGGCTDTTSNAGDFSVAAPAPRNTSSAAADCNCN